MGGWFDGPMGAHPVPDGGTCGTVGQAGIPPDTADERPVDTVSAIRGVDRRCRWIRSERELPLNWVIA
jgi:hypothetical protein